MQPVPVQQWHMSLMCTAEMLSAHMRMGQPHAAADHIHARMLLKTNNNNTLLVIFTKKTQLLVDCFSS